MASSPPLPSLFVLLRRSWQRLRSLLPMTLQILACGTLGAFLVGGVLASLLTVFIGEHARAVQDMSVQAMIEDPALRRSLTIVLLSGAGFLGAMLLLLSIGWNAILVAALERERSFVALLGAGALLLPTMIGVWLWMLLRSFGWVALLALLPLPVLAQRVFLLAGAICLLAFLPRLALAPVIVARGTTSVRATVEESLRRTRGRFAALFLDLLLVAVLVVALQQAAMTLLALVTLLPAILKTLLLLFWQQLTIVFGLFFLVELEKVLSGEHGNSGAAHSM